MSSPAFTFSYFGRDVDIYVLEVPSPTNRGQAALRFPEKVRVTAGVQKLAQQYVITLFTAPGSDFIENGLGTAVGELLLGGMAPLEEEIRHIINIGNAEAVDLLIADQTDALASAVETIPDDELLDTAIVRDIRILDKTRVEFEVELVTVAGSSRTYLVPLPIVV